MKVLIVPAVTSKIFFLLHLEVYLKPYKTSKTKLSCDVCYVLTIPKIWCVTLISKLPFITQLRPTTFENSNAMLWEIEINFPNVFLSCLLCKKLFPSVIYIISASANQAITWKWFVEKNQIYFNQVHQWKRQFYLNLDNFCLNFFSKLINNLDVKLPYGDAIKQNHKLKKVEIKIKKNQP